jgi:streptogramin lyase
MRAFRIASAVGLLLCLSSISFGQAIMEFPLPSAGSAPWGIATGPDGALWFTESGRSRIGRITTTGVVSEFAIPTPNSGPVGIASGPDATLWFAEDSAGKVGRITLAGEITEFPTGAFAVGDSTGEIARGSDGNMWFTEWDAGQIGRITSAGVVTLFTIPDTPLQGANLNPSDIAAGPDGALWFTEANGNKIGRITTGGAITLFVIPGATNGTRSITAGPDGALWFTESAGRIGRITTDGIITEFPIPAASSDGITSGSDGALWFTESTEKIGRITTSGIVTEFPIPTARSGPNGITSGPDGNVWFTENRGNKIGRITIGSPALEERVLPIVGSTPGAGGTFFKTAVQLHNPASSGISGRIVFHPSGVTGSGADPILVYSLSSGETQSIADLLPAMGRSGLGSADIEVTAGSAPVATVRVFNDAGSAGTTGFTEVPMRREEALRPGQQGVLLLPTDITGFRFNIGVRTLEAGAAATLVLREASGAVVETISRSYPPTYHQQQSANAFLGVTSLPPGGSIEINPSAGAAIFYGATVDNTTGDPSLQIARAAP